MNNSFEKYKQLLLNVLYYSTDDHGKKIPKTKLAKLIYLVDFAYYYEHLKPISNMEYIKLPQGPVPHAYFSALDDLYDRGVIDIEKRGKAELYSIIEYQSVKNDLLNADEIELIKRVAKKWSNNNVQEIVDFTHKQIPYSICYDGEIIPYNLITQEDPKNIY